jgi:hypothetical protein
MKVMIKLPMLGTTEKTESSRYQVMLTDKTNKSLKPLEYPKINRFFDNLNDRNTFIEMFEATIHKSGGKLVHNIRLSHPSFESFDIFDKQGNTSYEITVYH